MINAIRGMNDIGPDETVGWQFVEQQFRELMAGYGYREVRLPLLEKTELFKRSIGEVTDIVEKEMYTFDDRNGDSLTLRPEGTAGCVRAGLEHGWLYNQIQRLWYAGPMFRHERPQKGRYRQFHQLGVEVFGLAGPDVDAELIAMTARFWHHLGVADKVTLELNSLGTPAARTHYREVLVAYLEDHRDQLDEDSQRRLKSNPLRILDSKNPDMRALLEDAPQLVTHLDTESREHFDAVCERLTDIGVAFTLNTNLVRGLDYYSRTVFEWVTDALGAQGTVCAGGRYDGLVEQLGGKPNSAVGFALGMERLVALVEEGSIPHHVFAPHAYLLMVGDDAQQTGFKLAEQLRDAIPDLRLISHCGGGSFKSQMKKADKSGAVLALILGDEEVQAGEIGIKFLREDRAQQSVNQAELQTSMQKLLRKSLESEFANVSA